MIKIVDLDRTVALFRAQAGDKFDLDAAKIRSLPEPQQVEALFGTLTGSPFNIWLWRLDDI